MKETCEDYNKNLDKTVCEKISSFYYSNFKWVYDSKNNLCISENLSCTSMKIDWLKDQWEFYGLENNIKCAYSNGKCSLDIAKEVTDQTNIENIEDSNP